MTTNKDGKVKITYRTAYDQYNRICGHVMAKYNADYDCYTINEKQYKRCLDNRVIGGTAGVIFNAEWRGTSPDNAAIAVTSPQNNNERGNL